MDAPVAQLDSVSMRYQAKSPFVLRDVSLTIQANETVGVTGPSGAGKSTLLNVLGLLQQCTSGEYSFLGQPAGLAGRRRRAALRAEHIGFVFQGFHLLDGLTALENVQLAYRYRSEAATDSTQHCRDLLVKVGLEDKAHAAVDRLSGGQQQRVAIARALVGRPALVLCDEPTGNLDSASAKVVLDTLKAIVDEQTALVVVTHDHGIADSLDRVLRVSVGDTAWL